MKTKLPTKLKGLCLILGMMGTFTTYGQFTQTVVGTIAPGPNAIEKSATTMTLATFQGAVGTAFTNGVGGVISFPTAVPAATTQIRGNYGTNGRRMQITTSVTMQNITSSTFGVASTPNATTSSSDQSDYTLTLGLFDTNSGLPVVGRAIQQVGFIILSRNSAAYPIDLKVTATFSDNSTQVVTSPIGAGLGADDTFFGFTAPAGQGVTSLRFQSFSPGTPTPVVNRIGWDDFGFITGASAVTPAPQIVNLNVAAFSIHKATNGILFNALTYESGNATNISLVVNSVDVSSQLVFSGDSTNYSVAYNGLVAGQEYTAIITVTNSAGVATLTRTFYTATAPFPLFDSEGFTSETIYPLGALQAVTHGRGIWAPNASEPAQIVDAGGANGKVLQRDATGASRADFLSFPPLSSGTLVLEFDAFASTTASRTMDINTQPNAGSTMGCFLAWGEVPGKIAYFDNVSWLPIADIPTDWHHVKIINYLSGPAAGTYDVLLNGTAVALETSLAECRGRRGLQSVADPDTKHRGVVRVWPD